MQLLGMHVKQIVAGCVHCVAGAYLLGCGFGNFTEAVDHCKRTRES